jgi:exosortase/archaeosortase family protein
MAPSIFKDFYLMLFSNIFNLELKNDCIWLGNTCIYFVPECYGLVGFSAFIALLHAEKLKKKYIVLLSAIALPFFIILNFLRIYFMLFLSINFGFNIEILHVIGWFISPLFVFGGWILLRDYLIEKCGHWFEELIL